ncbi:MAG: von Willebrand factor type A domain-containing protein [Chitinophagaceae bacterium]
MKYVCSILIALVSNLPLVAQFYFRGEVKDEAGKPLANAKIILHTTGYIYYSGSAGGFGITHVKSFDSATVSMDGFQPCALKLQNNKYENIMLKAMISAGNLQKKRLISFTKDMKIEELHNWNLGGETYSNLLENEFIEAKKFPETGFAISIDKASYSNIRRFINMNSSVPPDAVRIEEMLNYFNFSYKKPANDNIFGFDSYLTTCPWDAAKQLLIFKICAKQVQMDLVPAGNLVFLIDVSGSMDMPNRLPLLKSAFKLLVNNLRDKDTVAIVVYGSSVGIWMQPTSGREKQKIIKSIEGLTPGGATAGASGIATAYALAKSKYIPGGNNRVILATDGDFNVGQTSEEQLESMISQQRQSGIYLTCLGVGMGNYKDSKLEVLAKKGNGNFAYLDDEKEAEKVLVKELTQTLYTVADDAFLNIEFNPQYVKQYRLIGFDNKVNAVADSSSELEGGEVGSGHTLLAMAEFTPATPLDNMEHLSAKEVLAKITVNYKNPNDTMRLKSSYNCPVNFTEFSDLEKCYQFAGSVVMFASLLKKSKYFKMVTWNDTLYRANESYDAQDPIQKEFLEIIGKAKRIYAKEKRKK